MLAQDPLTGYVHEVPDAQFYEPEYYGEAPEFAEYPEQYGEVVYDGLGNPVGILPFLPAIGALAAKALPAVASALPGIGKLVSGALPAVGQAVSGLLPGVARAIGGMMPGARPPMPFPMPGMRLPFPGMRPPMPPGWVRPPMPYQGMVPRRFYMRCFAWPGPRGLVPASALQPLPAPTAMPPAGAPVMRRRRRRRR